MMFLDFFVFLIGIFIKPIHWQFRMEEVSVPKLVDELCEEIHHKRPLKLSASTIAYIIRPRVLCSLKWRKRRCLINSLLLMYYFGRIRQINTIHINCCLGYNNKLAGHSWITGPNFDMINKKFLPLPQDDEIYSKTFYPDQLPPSPKKCIATSQFENE
jgi:hypothetical protein